MGYIRKCFKISLRTILFLANELRFLFVPLSSLIQRIVSNFWYKKIANVWTSLYMKFILIIEYILPRPVVVFIKKILGRRIVFGLGLPLATFFIVLTFVHSATYSFTQSSWIGGADTTATSTHASNQSNWTKYYSSTGLDVGTTVSVTPTSYAFTDDGATSTTPSASTAGGGFSNGTLSLTAVSGSGSGASVGIVPTLNAVNNWDTVLKAVPFTVSSDSFSLRNNDEDYIYVVQGNNTNGFYRYSISNNTWTALTSVPGNISSGSTVIRHGSEDYIYVLRGYSSGFYRYSISGNSWTTLNGPTRSAGTGSKIIRNGSEDYMYFLRADTDVFFERYSISGNSWVTLASMPLGGYAGTHMSRIDGDDYIYVSKGNNGTQFYRYSISGDSWTTLASAPGGIAQSSQIIRNSSEDYIYAVTNSNLYRYSISGDSWSTLASLPGLTGTGSKAIRNGTEDYIYVTRGNSTTGFYRYSISGNSWTTLTSLLANVGVGGEMLRDGISNHIYVISGDTSSNFFRYSISDNSWTGSSVSNLTSVPSIGALSINIRNGSDNDIYVVRGTGGPSTSLYKYSISGNSWTTLTSIGATIGYGSSAIRYGTENYIYYIPSSNSSAFYRYSISGNSWTTLTSAPGTIMNGSAMIRNGSDDDIYVTQGASGLGTGFYKYSISGNSWTTLTSLPAGISDGSSMIRNGSDDYIYVTRGNNSTGFYRYSISGNSWTTLTATPLGLSYGSAVIRNGSDNDIYVTRGNFSTGFYKYSISDNSWTTLTSVPSVVSFGGAMLRNGADNDIYVLVGNTTGNFYKYSISGNSWVTYPSLPVTINSGSYMIRNSSDNEIYITSGNSTGFYKFIINTTTYDPSGVFTSAPINLAGGGNFSTVSFSTTLNSQTITLKARSSESSDFSSAPAWGGCSTITNNASLSTGGCVTDGHQYVQYQATLSTSNNLVTPTLDSVTINYNQYASGTLISSPYDTSSEANLISRISWTESSTSSNQTIKFQVRSSGDGITWSNWCGPSNTCDGNDYFLYSNNGVSFDSNHPLRDGVNDRYLQYKVVLSSGGAITPELSEVNVQYVVNAPPEFDATYGTNGVTATQITDVEDANYGKVSISYRVRDPDGSTGTITPGYVTPSFEYNIGGGWVAIDQSALSAGDTSNKSADDNNYATYTAMWSATTSIVGAFSSTTQLRVSVNDNEAANNFGRAVSAQFALDTKSPTQLSILDSSENVVILSSSDDSQLQYRLCNDNSFPSSDTQGNSCGWSALSGNLSSSSIPWLPSKDASGNETVYIQIRDIAGNYTYHTIVAPSLPSNFDFKDISNTLIDSYREFLSWAVFQATSSSSFSSYKLYHSTDGVSYNVLTTINNPAINYYHHNITTGTSSTHFYKLVVEDTDGDISDYTTIMSDVPNGQGSSDTTAPTIDPGSILVPGGNLKNTSVQVTFTTDELAKGEVEYRQNGSSTWIAASSVSYVLSHSMYIQNLTPTQHTIFVYEQKMLLET